jgi:hypothetical protein
MSFPIGDNSYNGMALPSISLDIVDYGAEGGPVTRADQRRSSGIFSPASIATGSRFSGGGSGQVARSV